MTHANLAKAKGEALRFLEKVKELEKSDANESTSHSYYWASKQSGAVKRASMDLTRALAEMRKPN
jgi:hypothetical protein